MMSYTDADICKGAGAFEQAMRMQAAVAGTGNRMTAQVAVGVLSAAMRGGMPVSKLGGVIDETFAADAPQLKRILATFEGHHWDIHLWNALDTDRYKLCTDLCRPGLVSWRYDRNGGAADLD